MVATCQLEQQYDFWEIQMKPIKNTRVLGVNVLLSVQILKN